MNELENEIFNELMKDEEKLYDEMSQFKRLYLKIKIDNLVNYRDEIDYEIIIDKILGCV